MTKDDNADRGNAWSRAGRTVGEAESRFEKCRNADAGNTGLSGEEAEKTHGLMLSVRELMQDYRKALLRVAQIGAGA